jgi:hypothetical protein
VQRLKAQAAELHGRARCDAAEHDLLCKNVKYTALHGCLEVAWGCRKVARDDCDDVI